MLLSVIVRCGVVFITTLAMLGSGSIGSARANDGISDLGSEGVACMARVRDAAPQVPKSEAGSLFHIVALPQASSSFAGKGFAGVDCRDANLATQSQVSSYRDKVCGLASSGNEAVQDQLEKSIGERPAVLCANATLILGSWPSGNPDGE